MMTRPAARRDPVDPPAHRSRATVASIVLIVMGTTLETVGIALAGIGPIRYVLMGAGLLLLLVAVLRLTRRGDDRPADPADPGAPSR